MPRLCKACTSPQAAEITKAIAAGGSNRDVASRFNLTISAVQRHRCLHLRQPRAVKPSETSRTIQASPTSGDSIRFDSAAATDPKTLVATTARLLDEALDLLARAKGASDNKTALSALREARDGLALLMRVAGMLAPDAVTNVQIDARRQVATVLDHEFSLDDLRAARAQLVAEPIEVSEA